MKVQYSISERGRANLGSVGGHLDRMLKALAVKPRTSAELEKIVAKESNSPRPVTLSSWYLSRAHDLGWVSRKVVD